MTTYTTKKEHKSALGICIGASTVSSVLVYEINGDVNIESHQSIPHHGNPKKIIEDIFSAYTPQKVTITGRKFKQLLNATSISESEAIENSIAHLGISPDLIISAGGENFILYVIDKKGKVSKAITGNKCASGTGEFFLQQIKRMNLSVDDAITLGNQGEPYNISGRCSVFCKSDCTHALNKGVEKESVVAGLSRMMAQKIIELTSRVKYWKVALIGGASKNTAMKKYLEKHFDDLTIPPASTYFEALGTAIYALNNPTQPINKEKLFKSNLSSFTFHEDLKKYSSAVRFEKSSRGIPVAEDNCILGLDVGSTTTKAVLLRIRDNSILASEYLRTNGDPISASIDCYKSLKNQINVPLNILGLGVTGSGRHIAGLHALTKGVINEIIAHATATIHFDPEVDTIFEIGGQDAKYTYITSGVASDYAMNEACSAGTGSFLEEAANESLNINYLDIGEIALRANNPPNFNDQCSAFISSDIKNALQEGLSKADVVAGLVYSICLNYINRVKGNRPTGDKIFMQGGVCYNKAVPIAMAALTGKEIIVPPEPGLMGAFGVALEIKKRLELKLMPEQVFNLDELINRKVEYGKSFVCAGGAEKCDRKCSVSIILINGKKYPFGGACNKYYNLHEEFSSDIRENNLVNLRQELVFDKFIYPIELPRDAKTIGIPKSFLTNTLFPLYYNFFIQLGFKVVLGDNVKQLGIEKKESAFCFPVELAHGFFQDLIDRKVDYIFLPHVLEVFNKDNEFFDRTCVLLQSEPYYLKTTFKEDFGDIKILSPIISFAKGYESAKDKFIQLALELGKDKPLASASFDYAVEIQKEMLNTFKQIGKNVIQELEADPERFAIVLFGRAYNSFAKEANLGIPQKFASRNVMIIPHDFLSSDSFESHEHMYWGLGKQILQSARFVKNHPQLFGTYITNFSCGPDSMIITYFRNIMENKPSLTLELDSHSADAGINTRIEAALDIIKSYRQLEKKGKIQFVKKDFRPLKVKNATTIVDSNGEEILLTDKRVKMLIPNMGNYAAQAFAAVFRSAGINSEALPVSTFKTLTSGRGVTSCKECLPLILNAGAMIDYYHDKKPKDEKTLFFMAEGTGPCRFGQYHVYLEEIIKKRELKDYGVYTLTDEDSYGGLGDEFFKRGWISTTTVDVIQNIFHAINVIAVNKTECLQILAEEWEKIVRIIEGQDINKIYQQLEILAEKLSHQKKKIKYKDAVKVALIGEIYVRQDEFSRMDLIERLAEKDIVVKVAPISEYIYYSNFMAMRSDGHRTPTIREISKLKIKNLIQERIERKIKNILSESGFCDDELIKVDDITSKARHLINPQLAGEAILTVGSGLREILDHVSGIISIGPFGCMPSRVAESILNSELNIEGKATAENLKRENYNNEIDTLPFLAIETDGNMFPQVIQSKIEIFILQTQRLHKIIKSGNAHIKQNYAQKFYDFIVAQYKKRLQGNKSEEYLPDIAGLSSQESE
ncbi:MAG: activase [Ignavibacteriaceae bacterium]|nr:activase [Ignavibacteriaceae bacterium]